MTDLKPERCDFVNDDLSLIQKTDGLTFGTDALLLAGYATGKGLIGAELGGGSGIISMLMLSRGKLSHATSIEIQEEYATLTEKNAKLNGLSERLRSVCSDIREYKCEKQFDTVYSNPPYMTVTSGKANSLSKKNIARHEVFGTIYDFASVAAKILKFGGTFLTVYRPDRLVDLIAVMRENSLEPKRMTYVHADGNMEPSMVLTEAKRGGKCGLYLTPPLIIYKDSTHTEYTSDMNYIMENGSFPDKFIKR